MVSVNGFSVKNIKTMQGMEGIAMSGALYLCNKKVADFIDDGNGGMMEFYPVNSMLFDFAKQKVDEIYESYGFKKYGESLAVFIEEVVNMGELVKSIKRWAKKNAIDNPVMAIAVMRLKDFDNLKEFYAIGFANKESVNPASFQKSNSNQFEKIVKVVDNIMGKNVAITL